MRRLLDPKTPYLEILSYDIAVEIHHVLEFERALEFFIDGVRDGKFLEDPESRGKPRPTPMSDPAMMDGMMGMMKGNVAMMVPQSLIMGWINAFFSGYVISTSSLTPCTLVLIERNNRTCTVKLPFPITIKFKSMLQAGVQTKDMDPRWMSSISWYFLCIFGLQFVYVFLLGSDNGKSITCVCS